MVCFCTVRSSRMAYSLPVSCTGWSSTETTRASRSTANLPFGSSNRGSLLRGERSPEWELYQYGGFDHFLIAPCLRRQRWIENSRQRHDRKDSPDAFLFHEAR